MCSHWVFLIASATRLLPTIVNDNEESVWLLPNRAEGLQVSIHWSSDRDKTRLTIAANPLAPMHFTIAPIPSGTSTSKIGRCYLVKSKALLAFVE
jgi:hypothetical protein